MISWSSWVPQLHPQKCTQILGATNCYFLRFGGISRRWENVVQAKLSMAWPLVSNIKHIRRTALVTAMEIWTLKYRYSVKIALTNWDSVHTWNTVSIGGDPSSRGPISDTPTVTSHRPDAVLESWLGNQPATDLTISMAILKPKMKKKMLRI